MTQPHTNPESFDQFVASMIQRVDSYCDIRLLRPGQILINGRIVRTETLRRMVSMDPENCEPIVVSYFEKLFRQCSQSEVHSWDSETAAQHIMPRIQPVTIFEHLDPDQVAHVPFVGETCVVFVADLPDMTISLTSQQTSRWGFSDERQHSIAVQNLVTRSADLRWELVESRDGGRAALVNRNDGYDASLVLLPDLHARLAQTLGTEFLVGMPGRDFFVAFSKEPSPFASRVRQRIAHDYARLPFPITKDPLLVVRDGIVAAAC